MTHDGGRIGEVILVCKRRGAAGGVARQLLGVYMQERLRHGGVVHAGATRGDADGRSPTQAWRRLGFTHLDSLSVREGEHSQDDVMVLRVP